MPPDTTEQARDWRQWRKEQRARLLSARSALSVETRASLSGRVVDRLLLKFGSRLRGITGVYWPLPGELDILPLAERLHASGGMLALPVVVGRGLPLAFHAWAPGDAVVAGAFGTAVPVLARLVQPATVILPLVGFDQACFRLGYGGGYYDRTLQATAPRPFAIGVGFAASCLPSIFPRPHDVALDAIVTEDAVHGRGPEEA